MIWNVLSALGGVGMFLVGMLLLTTGLKGVAGQRIRSILARFTRTPSSGALFGALTTAAVQSSSATTVAAVGFVASGLLTFPQAIGIIFGANIGTTITGWMVAILGFKLDLGEVVLPLILVGALLQLSGRRQMEFVGQALAGFSLLFIGIDHMKEGLAAFEGVVTPDNFPSDTLWGRLQLVLIGLLITVVTQSSSAGVATALAALGAGTISFSQAAALVIGMDVGTTLTALLATIGGGTMARRTGLAHVVYNLMTAVIALFLLGPFANLASGWIARGDGQIALVAFHSCFNLLGVVLILPFAAPFARMVERLVPERGSRLTRGLDPALLAEPAIAAELSVTALERLNTAVCDHLGRSLGRPLPEGVTGYERSELEEGLVDLRSFIEGIRLPAARPDLAAATVASFHALDHLFRLLYRCDQTDRLATLDGSGRLGRLRCLLASGAIRQARPREPVAAELWLDRLRMLMGRQRQRPRDRIIEAAVAGHIADETAFAQVDTLRWLHRVSYHLWRVRVHQNAIRTASAPVPSPEEARIDIAQD